MNLKDAGIYDIVNILKGIATAAHNSSQGGIINSTPRVINIPAYQRPYRWTADNIKRLFQDYDENNAEYFLGSAVVVEKKRGDSLEFDVVDGQQRMTTLYLLNYIRFLFKREYVLEKLAKPYQPKSSEYCNSLKECYVGLVGKNSAHFDNILKKINILSEDEDMDPNERVDQLVGCYKTELCIPQEKSTSQETLEERLKQAHAFFDGEQLCLKYSRQRYDNILRDALCNVYLKKVPETNNYELATIVNNDDSFSKNYIDAMTTVFDNIWQRARTKLETENALLSEICEKAIEYSDEIIRNMSLCIVLTENENDANKLFEVLNDRALEVEDLELIKNHFYKEYCTKSDDSDEDKDKHITELDEVWADKIFSGNGEMRNRLISYLAAVYFTGDKELGYKDDAKLKDAIEKNYSSKFYPIGKTKYEYQNIVADFNVYYAVKMILDSCEIKTQRLYEVSLRAEQEEKSITYKALHLLNALKYHAVVPAITNIIIKTYAQNHSMIAPDFDTTFKAFLKGLIDDKDHSKVEYEKIHKGAFMLWVSALKGKDYTIPRSIAKRIINKYNYNVYDEDEMDFLGAEIQDLNKDMDEWLDEWAYSSNKTFAIKVLLLNLLLSSRTPLENGYKRSVVRINLLSALTYKLDAGKLQLDHLEANEVNESIASKYYLSSDREQRQKDVNGYLGNFMVLDATDNNIKNNVPLAKAMGYYSKIEKAWLVDDINKMISDSDYFDTVNNVPKTAFFVTRSRQLKKYFKAFLNRKLSEKEFDVFL